MTGIPEQVKARLRYCRVASDRLTLAHFPDFFIVGPQRTGTTWLHQVLWAHPDVLLTEPKELFFFSRLKEPRSPRFESAELDWYLDHFRTSWLRWPLLQARTLLRCGQPWRPRVRGEATASYAAMDADLVDEIATLNPNTKALFTVRHPVDRAWSHAKKDLARNRGRQGSAVTDDEWKAFFRDPYQLRCADYEGNIATWKSRLGDDNVFVGTFEQVRQEPEQLLRRVAAFLGVRDDLRFVDPRLLRQSVNPAGGSGIPDHLRAFLEELLAEHIEGWKRVVAREVDHQATDRY